MHGTKIKTLNIVYIYHLCYKPVKVVCNKSWMDATARMHVTRLTALCSRALPVRCDNTHPIHLAFYC
jgi:hypothetical protein